MRSTASIRGHPIHPALIPFPFAFLYGAFFFDLAGVLLGRPSWWATGAHLAVVGVIAAVIAAVPGAIDYFTTVPPRSSGKRRATLHAASNLGAVALFALAWWLRAAPEVSPPAATLVLEGVGIVLLTMGGWMGGTLVYRNQVGVDHRYAGAGSWREAKVPEAPGAPVTVARRDELEPGQMKLLHLDGRRIVLGRTAEGYVAFDDRCTHHGGSLAGGALIGPVVQCPWHGSQFDVRTGAVEAGPAREGIATYPLEETSEEVRLVLRAPGGTVGRAR